MNVNARKSQNINPNRQGFALITGSIFLEGEGVCLDFQGN